MNVEYEKEIEKKKTVPDIGDLFKGDNVYYIRLDETSRYLDPNDIIVDNYVAMAMDGTIWSVNKSDTIEVIEHTLVIKGVKE